LPQCGVIRADAESQISFSVFFTLDCDSHSRVELPFFEIFQNLLLKNFALVCRCDGNQDGPSLKDPLQVPDGPITRSRAKKIKEAMQGLVQSTWDEASKSPTIKVGLKEGEPILIHLIQAVEDMT
jgi:hypothetical protein